MFLSRMCVVKIFAFPAYVELPASLLTTTKPPQGTSQADTNASPNLATSSASTLSKEPKKKHQLTATNDVLFRELRDLNFSGVGLRLNKNARRLEEDFKVYRTFKLSLRQSDANPGKSES